MANWHSDERTHEIHCHVLHQKYWSVTFHDYRDRDTKFPWLLLETAEEVLKLLTWGHISDEDLEQHHRDLRRWGVGGGVLHLTTRQYHQLKARRVGWPWNGYELQKMKDAGTYPPKPLSEAQEAEFMKRRRQ
jgi:hypothetical protein